MNKQAVLLSELALEIKNANRAYEMLTQAIKKAKINKQYNYDTKDKSPSSSLVLLANQLTR
jgi:hypothetical protein